MDEFDWVRSFSGSNDGTISQVLLPTEQRESPNSKSRGSFASFVCHVTNLESKLRTTTPIVLDDSSPVRTTGRILGQGKTFIVRHALWTKTPQESPMEVALKEITPEEEAEDDTIGYSQASMAHIIAADR